MRETRVWRSSARKSLQEQANLPRDQIEALLDLELLLFAIEKLGLQSEFDRVTASWILISSRFYLFPKLNHLITTPEAKRILFNLRQLLPYLTNEDNTEQLVRLYRQIPSRYRAYEINDTYGFSRKLTPSVWGNRFEHFDELLSNKLKYRTRSIKYAEPGKEYKFSSEENVYSVRIPESLPLYPGNVISLHRDNIEAITITRREMEEAALRLEECCGGNYIQRLQDIIIEEFQDQSFTNIDAIVLDKVKNLVGLLNAGKSTLIEILTVALAIKKQKIGVVFSEVVTCLRMASLLKKVGLKVSVAIGQRNRKLHLENWHNVDGGLDGFEHLSTACPLSSYFQPTIPASPPCFNLREKKDEDNHTNNTYNSVRACPLIGQCPRHRDANQLSQADVILTTVASSIFTRPLPHVSPQSITYYELMYRVCSVVFLDECDKVQSNLDSTFLPAIKLVEKGSNGFLDQVVTWTRSHKLRNSRNDLRVVNFGQFNHAVQNADALVDNICTQLQLSPNESEWLIKKQFFTCSSLAQDLVRDLAQVEGIDPEINTLILEKDDKYVELVDFLRGDWKNSWLAEYAMRLKSENYQEQQTTILKIQQELITHDWLKLKSIEARWEFSCRFALLLKLVLFVFFFQQAIDKAYGLSEFADSADEIVFFNRIPRDFYRLIPGLATGLLCGFKLEQQENQLTLLYFQAIGQGRWLLEHFSNVFADEGTQGAHALLLSGTSIAGNSPIYNVDRQVDYLLSPQERGAIETISQSKFDFSPCYWADGKPVRVSGTNNKEEGLLQIARSLLLQTNNLQLDFDALPEGRKRLLWYVNSYDQVDFLYKIIREVDNSREWSSRVAALTSRSPIEDMDESLIPRGNVENFATTAYSILLAPISAIGRGKNMLNEQRLSAFGGAYFLVRPHPAPDDLDYKFRLALCEERKEIARERQGNLVESALAWRKDGYITFLKNIDTYLQYSSKRLSKEVRGGLIWSQMVLTWQAIARTIRGNQPTLIRFIDAAWLPDQAATEEESLLKGFKYVLKPYFSKNRTGFDTREVALVRSLYEPFYNALEKIDGL